MVKTFGKLARIWPMCVLLGSGLAGAQTPQQPALSVEHGWIGAADALARMQDCTPNLRPSTLERWRNEAAAGRSDATATSFFTDQSNGKFVATRNDLWACLDLSPTGFVQMPFATLQRSLTFTGISASAEKAFLQKLIEDLAQGGFAKGMVQLKGSKRMLVYLSATSGASVTTNIRTATAEAGSFNEADFANRLDEVPNSTVVRTIGNGIIDFLSGVLTPRPLFGQYLRIDGNAKTAATDFTGTTWQFRMDPAASIRFEPGGVLVFRGRTGNSMASWAKEGNALYFGNTRVFYSAQLDESGAHMTALQRTLATIDATGRGFNLPEYRGTQRFVRSDDTQAMASIRSEWEQKAAGIRQQLEAQRKTRLQETPTAEWETQKGPGGQWSLCDPSLKVGAGFLQSLNGETPQELCRAFMGTRKLWQGILENGCEGRCAPFVLALPSTTK